MNKHKKINQKKKNFPQIISWMQIILENNAQWHNFNNFIPPQASLSLPLEPIEMTAVYSTQISQNLWFCKRIAM